MMSNKAIKLVFLSLIALLLSGCLSLFAPSVEPQRLKLKAGQYRLDPKHTSVLFKIGHLNLSTYVGRFNQMDASLNFNPLQMDKTRLEATVEIASLDVNDKQLKETLLSDDWFNVSAFPQALLTTISVEPLTDNIFIFNALLTLKEKSLPIKLKAIFHGGADNWLSGFYTLGFSATGEISRTDFGIDSYVPLVGDKVKIEIFAEFLKQEG